MIVFTHIPKTAGTSLKFILRCNFGIHHVDSRNTKRKVFTDKDLSFAKKVFPGVQAITGHNLTDPPRYIHEPGVQLITMLRQPVVRCASHYQDLVLRRNLEESFETWIRNPPNQNRICKTLTGSDDVDRAKILLKEYYQVVGITEHFQDSLKLLQLHMEKPLALYNKKRVAASSNEIKDSLLGDETSLSLLKKYNHLDQQIYDFALEEIFLPAVGKYREAMNKIEISHEKCSRKHSIRRSQSIRYNKYLYRPLVRFLKA
ncbi:MAG: sulfotransferase family 2 domain-containing protein [Bacteroidota bacterium]